MAALRTKVCTEVKVQQWVVEGFSQLPWRTGCETQSGEFEAGGRTWTLSLYPGGVDDDKKEFVSLYVDLVDAAEAPLRARYQFAILNQAGERVHTSPISRFLQFATDDADANVSWGSPEFLRRAELLDGKGGFLLDDTCVFEVRLFFARAASPPRTGATATRCKEAIGQALAPLLASGALSDVTLVVDGADLHAHRVILAARSPVFKAMFAHKMSEALQGTVLISDVSLPVFRELLTFIYTGQLSSDPAPVLATAGSSSSSSSSSHSSSSSSSSVPGVRDSKEAKEEGPSSSVKATDSPGDLTAQLLVAADRFQVGDLVQLCAERLAASLSVTNLADQLRLADRCGAPQLVAGCLDYLRADSSRLAQVMDTDGYALLDREQMHMLLTATLPPGKSPGKLSRKRARPPELTTHPELQRDAIKRLKVPELQLKLAEQGLDTHGLEADLVERLTTAVYGPSLVRTPLSLDSEMSDG